MDAAACSSFRALSLSEFHEKYLKENLHSDGRSLVDFRSSSMQLGVISTANGSVLMKHGNTTVMVSVKAELCEPRPEKPDQGFVILSIDGSGANLTDQQHSQLWQYQNILNEMVERGMFLSPRSLCIKESHVVWVLYCHLVCLDSDGAILDTCVAALVAALKDTKLPQVTCEESAVVKGNKTTETNVNFDVKNSLELSSFPVASTFACYAVEGGEGKVYSIVSDPSEEEMLLFSSCVTVAVGGSNVEDPVCGIWCYSRNSTESFIQSSFEEKNVSASNFLLSESGLNQILAVCRGRYSEISRLITEALKVAD